MSLTASRPGERVFFAGGAGRIETVLNSPAQTPRGIALVAHPHPLYGGTLDNKVVQTLAKAFVELGWISARPNFRGAGDSEGEHDHGVGEAEDMVLLAGQVQERFGGLPLALAGFSFGAYVQTLAAPRLHPRRLVLVAPPNGMTNADRRYVAHDVPPGTLVIHGERDETVPLANVLDWARPRDLPIVVVPGADHFFHRRLRLIKLIVQGAWRD